MRLAFASLWLAIALPAAAASLGDRYPAGSIKNRAQAEAALRDADAEQTRVDRETKVRDAECLKRFLVNRCRDEVRRDKLTAERELRRVRVEAHDLQRVLDAQEAARKRAGTAAQATQPPRAGAPRSAEPKAGRKISPEEAARNSAETEAREAEHAKRVAQDGAKAAERTENAREYAEKQAEAARRAEENAAQRKKTEQRRAERRRQLEAQEAQREKVRRKAEEEAAAAGK